MRLDIEQTVASVRLIVHLLVRHFKFGQANLLLYSQELICCSGAKGWSPIATIISMSSEELFRLHVKLANEWSHPVSPGHNVSWDDCRVGTQTDLSCFRLFHRFTAKEIFFVPARCFALPVASLEGAVALKFKMIMDSGTSDSCKRWLVSILQRSANYARLCGWPVSSDVCVSVCR
jgi:hypothetical protein